MSLKQNYQNYKYLSYIIATSIIVAIVVCIALSIYGMTIGDWNNDFIIEDDRIKKKNDDFSPPPYCIIPSITSVFCF